MSNARQISRPPRSSRLKTLTEFDPTGLRGSQKCLPCVSPGPSPTSVADLTSSVLADFSGATLWFSRPTPKSMVSHSTALWVPDITHLPQDIIFRGPTGSITNCSRIDHLLRSANSHRRTGAHRMPLNISVCDPPLVSVIMRWGHWTLAKSLPCPSAGSYTVSFKWPVRTEGHVPPAVFWSDL